jgi:FixJ family two-component response regulator
VKKAHLVSIVEDDRFFRESMERLLRSLGYTVEAFASAAEFLAFPRRGDAACLIADVNLPAMSGIDLYRRLVDSGNGIPTILMTAYPSDVERMQSLNDGAVCYLRKPFDEQELERCLRLAIAPGRKSGP